MKKNIKFSWGIVSLILIVAISWAVAVYFHEIGQTKLLNKLGREGIDRKAQVIDKEISLFNSWDYKQKDVGTILIDLKKNKTEYGKIYYRYSDLKKRIIETSAYVPEDIFKNTHVGDGIAILYDPDKTERSMIKAIVLEKYKEYSK